MLPLRHINLEITSRCNMSCRHCCQESYLHKKNDLSFQELILLIKELRSLGIRSVVISGGEPFLRHDLFEIFNSFENNGINVSAILTNGLLLTYSRSDVKNLTAKENANAFYQPRRHRTGSNKIKRISQETTKSNYRHGIKQYKVNNKNKDSCNDKYRNYEIQCE